MAYINRHDKFCLPFQNLQYPALMLDMFKSSCLRWLVPKWSAVSVSEIEAMYTSIFSPL